VLQAEIHPLFAAGVGLGLIMVLGLHVTAALKEAPVDHELAAASPSGAAPSAKSVLHHSPPTIAADGFLEVCAVADIPEKRARIVCLTGERIAIFKYDGKISAVSNLCQHQNGPLGEGKIVDGCITCPWHGYQYLPDTGASPPPFVEKVPTFRVRVTEGRVFVHPQPNPPGTRAEPALVGTVANANPVGRDFVQPPNSKSAGAEARPTDGGGLISAGGQGTHGSTGLRSTVARP